MDKSSDILNYRVALLLKTANYKDETLHKMFIRLYKLERIFSQQVDLKSALDSKDF